VLGLLGCLHALGSSDLDKVHLVLL
jgi:hypothetical protein